jgi:Protein of unknown function (DUF3311)
MAKPGKSRIWYLLLLIPYIAILYVPFYNRVEPTLFGFPFFYWYQLLWIPLASILVFTLYRIYKT